jgi:hypothetical protein
MSSEIDKKKYYHLNIYHYTDVRVKREKKILLLNANNEIKKTEEEKNQ